MKTKNQTESADPRQGRTVLNAGVSKSKKVGRTIGGNDWGWVRGGVSPPHYRGSVEGEIAANSSM